MTYNLLYWSQWLFLLVWFIFNPSMKSNYIHFKMWDELAYPFSNCNGYAVEVWEWRSNFIHNLLGIGLLIHAKTEVNPC